MFDFVYYGFIEACGNFWYDIKYLCSLFGLAFVGLTLPIWFIPYAIYKKWGQK